MREGIDILVRVCEIVQVTPLVKRFRLEPLDGAPLKSFSAGSHVVVEMPDDNVIRRNAYSLMSPPTDPSGYMIGVRREESGRGGSRFMHDRVDVGMTLKISNPINLFPLQLHAAKHLLIAGGIGITPFLAMMEQLLIVAAPFELHYASRQRQFAAFAGDIAQRFGAKARFYFEEEGQQIDLDEVFAHQPLGTHVYTCGPQGMIEHVSERAHANGWTRHNVHSERFIAPAVGAPYDIELGRSGQVVHVKHGQSMLEAIEAAGIDAPYLCRGGACGQCETNVLTCEGVLFHADHYLTEDERASGRKVMPCVSRFEGKKLVLDL